MKRSELMALISSRLDSGLKLVADFHAHPPDTGIDIKGRRLFEEMGIPQSYAVAPSGSDIRYQCIDERMPEILIEMDPKLSERRNLRIIAGIVDGELQFGLYELKGREVPSDIERQLGVLYEGKSTATMFSVMNARQAEERGIFKTLPLRVQSGEGVVELLPGFAKEK